MMPSVTGADGRVSIGALRATDYWLKEIAAPLGFHLDPRPRKITVVKSPITTPQVEVIANKPLETPVLPVTG